MKDFDAETLKSRRPPQDSLEAVKFCLDALFADGRRRVTDAVAENLTYEELLGALLLARDEIERFRLE